MECALKLFHVRLIADLEFHVSTVSAKNGIGDDDFTNSDEMFHSLGDTPCLGHSTVLVNYVEDVHNWIIMDLGVVNNFWRCLFNF